MGASLSPHVNIATTLELEPFFSLRRGEFSGGVVGIWGGSHAPDFFLQDTTVMHAYGNSQGSNPWCINIPKTVIAARSGIMPITDHKSRFKVSHFVFRHISDATTVIL